MFNQQRTTTTPFIKPYDKNSNLTLRVGNQNDLKNLISNENIKLNEDKNKDKEKKDINKEIINQKNKEQNVFKQREKSTSFYQSNNMNFNNLKSIIENNIKKKSSENENKDSLDKKISDLPNTSHKSNNEIKKEEKEKKKEKEVESNTKKAPDITKSSISEKMKSLELYFMMRNEGLNKANTEAPKTIYKNENNNNNNTKTLSRANIIKDEWVKFESESMQKLQTEQDAYEFNENNYKERKYERDNVDGGKKFFRLRYIKNKLNLEKKQKENGTKENDLMTQQNIDKERILRKYNSDFLLIVEKSILSFNIKNYKESYEFLESSGIIKNIREYGEFLLVVSGFDKFLVGEFLAKEKYPNDKKEVLNGFIESISMDNKKVKFLECLRFLFSRLILPKDANMILEIMDKFSVTYFETNKSDSKFVNTFKSSDKIYLLVSTILALNTMFTRKDIKIKNVIKKDEFIKMNIDISQDFIEKLYEELKNNPISMSDDYNESVYRNLAPLVKEDEGNKSGAKNSRNSNLSDENRNNNQILENKKEETNTINNKIERKSKEIIIEEQITEEDEDIDDYCDDNKKSLEKKEFSLKNNLKFFTEEDQKILKTPHKFYKIKGSNKSIQKEYSFNEDFTKIYKNQNKKKVIDLKGLVNVYNGVNHNYNNNIKKYLKNNPSEEQFSGNFISLIFENEQLDLMSDDLQSALLWFKAIKSLLNYYGNNKRKSSAIKFIDLLRQKTKELWNHLINNWDIYGKYLITKLMEQNKLIINKEEKQNTIFEKEKNLSYKNIKKFLESISLKLLKDKEIENGEFFSLYYLGLPNNIRKKIWKILIGNPCGIYINTYEYVKKQIPKFNFSNLDKDNQKNKNFCQDFLSNEIINEIIKTKIYFLHEKKFKNSEEIMTQVYNISRGFFILRPDIPFNKSIISIIFFFLITLEEETLTFINIINIICSNMLKIYIGDKSEIKNCCNFFNILLKKYLPKIENHFSKLEITPQLYIIPWFEELFTRTFNIKILANIMDLYLLNGEYVLYQISLTILKTFEEDLISLTINDVFKILERFPDNIIETSFIYRMSFFSSIKKEFLEWKLNKEIEIQKSNLSKNI